MNYAMLKLALDAALAASTLYTKMRTLAQQGKELTPEQERELDANHAAIFAQPWAVPPES